MVRNATHSPKASFPHNLKRENAASFPPGLSGVSGDGLPYTETMPGLGLTDCYITASSA